MFGMVLGGSFGGLGDVLGDMFERCLRLVLEICLRALGCFW